MAIVKAPLKTDAAGKCSRWRVILYSPVTHEQEWHTVAGTRRQAEVFERAQKTRQASGVYIAKSERRTFAEAAAMFLKERRAGARRAGTLAGYESLLNLHLIPKFGTWEVGTIRRADIAEHFDAMRSKGATVQTVNRALRTMKAGRSCA